MPTFESINIGHELASRLVAIDNGDKITAVETPQALLSRHPQSLRLRNEDGSLSTNPIHCNGFPELRKEVATKLLALSLSGKRLALMESILQQQQEQLPELGEAQQAPISSRKIPGCVSVVDMLKYQKITTSNSLSTGSKPLDGLLALPNEMASSLSSSMNPRLCIPLQGLPWGHVIQCTGATATGKTQLALQLACSAVSNNWPVRFLCSGSGHQGCIRPLAFRLRTLACPSARSHNQVFQRMDLVSFQTVQDGYQLLTCLVEIEEACLSEESTSPRLVLLDSASGCLTTEDETLLQRVVLRLKHLARHYNLLVWINNSCVTPRAKNNQQRHSIDGNLPLGEDSPAPTSSKSKAALGTVWRRAWDINVSLKVVEKYALQQQPQQESLHLPMTIQATLEGHPFKKCNNSATAEFCITDNGIQDSQPTAAEEDEEA